VLANGSNISELHLPQAFGLALPGSTTPTTQPYGFQGDAGVYTDPITGLLVMWNRVYDPSIGQFLNPDPIGIRGGDPNYRQFVLNNPVRWIDALGFRTVEVRSALCDELEKFVHVACDFIGGCACKSGMSCAELRRRLQLNEGCLEAREQRDKECNYIDAGHVGERKNAEISIKRCKSLLKDCGDSQSQPQPQPQPCPAANPANNFQGVPMIDIVLLGFEECMEDPAACVGLEDPIMSPGRYPFPGGAQPIT
jgi:RHS repeat-associated protein